MAAPFKASLGEALCRSDPNYTKEFLGQYDGESRSKKMPPALIRTLLIAFLSLTTSVQAADTAYEAKTLNSVHGIWEASDDKGGAVGLNLWQVSSILFHGGAPNDQDEIFHPVLQIGVYERSKAKVLCGEENFFDTGWRGRKERGVEAKLLGEHLVVTYPQFPGETAMDLDIWWIRAEDVWRGRFHRGSFDRQVTLRRVTERPTHDQQLCVGPSTINSLAISKE